MINRKRRERERECYLRGRETGSARRKYKRCAEEFKMQSKLEKQNTKSIKFATREEEKRRQRDSWIEGLREKDEREKSV